MPKCGLSRLFLKNVQNCRFFFLLPIQILYFQMVVKVSSMNFFLYINNRLSFNFGMSYFSDVPKSAQGLTKSAQKSAQCLSKSEERGEPLRDNCKVLVQNPNPFILPEDSRALAAYYAENTALPRAALVERSPKRPIGLSKSAQKSAQALVERSPKRPIGLSKSAQKSAQALVERSPKEMRSPRRPQGQRKSGKICIHLKYKRF